MNDYNMILVEIDARGVATLMLNRADKHNALNAEMIAELTDAAAVLAGDAKVRVIVISAEGKSFCAGGDLGWMQEQAEKDRAGKMVEARALADMLMAFNTLPKPVITKVQGNAYGGGVGLMAVADIVIADVGATFALTETRLGLIPATIGPFVVRRMGEGFARQVFFTAKPFGVDIALRAGLVAQIGAADELDELVAAEVEAALACAPGAVASAKALCFDLGGGVSAEIVDRTINALADRWETDEAKDGITAFFDKRPAPWRL